MPQATEAVYDAPGLIQNGSLHLVLVCVWAPVAWLWNRPTFVRCDGDKVNLQTWEEVQPWQRWSCRCTRCSWGCVWWPLRNAPGNAAGWARYGCRSRLCSTRSGLHTCREHSKSTRCSGFFLAKNSKLYGLLHRRWCSASVNKDFLPGKRDIYHPRGQNLKWLAPKFILPSLVCEGTYRLLTKSLFKITVTEIKSWSWNDESHLARRRNCQSRRGRQRWVDGDTPDET